MPEAKVTATQYLLSEAVQTTMSLDATVHRLTLACAAATTAVTTANNVIAAYWRIDAAANSTGGTCGLIPAGTALEKMPAQGHSSLGLSGVNGQATTQAVTVTVIQELWS